MGRPAHRVRLENGLKLDINRLARDGFIRPGAATGPVGIQWTHDYWGDIASATITANLTGTEEGYFRIQIAGGADQCIRTVARPRHFGGHQWFFVCPYLNHRAMVLWMPPGASRFACRKTFGRSVAYASQFLDRDNRAHRGQSKINSRLCRIGGFDPDEWDFPPKPKWMRWTTYRRAEERFEGMRQCSTRAFSRSWLSSSGAVGSSKFSFRFNGRVRVRQQISIPSAAFRRCGDSGYTELAPASGNRANRNCSPNWRLTIAGNHHDASAQRTPSPLAFDIDAGAGKGVHGLLCRRLARCKISIRSGGVA
ncbi:MAG: hypothetical protein ACJ8F3_04000 [Xanthobacteraceae bacterium]